MSRTQVQLWYYRLKEGRKNVNGEDIEAVKRLILDTRQINIKEVADGVGISFSSRQATFTDVFWHEMCDSEDCFKIARVNTAQERLPSFNDAADLLKKVITFNESWVFEYDIEPKVQSLQWKFPEEPSRKKTRQVCYCFLRLKGRGTS